jgi:hypothetical protein
LRWNGKVVARRLAGCAVIGLIAFALVGSLVPIGPRIAHADGVKDWVINRIVLEVAKRVVGDPEMTDDAAHKMLDNAIIGAFRRVDEYASPEEIHARIESHCWRVYYNVLHPYRGGWYNDGMIPPEYADGNDYQQLGLCVMTGYVPSPDSDTAIDSE